MLKKSVGWRKWAEEGPEQDHRSVPHGVQGQVGQHTGRERCKPNVLEADGKHCKDKQKEQRVREDSAMVHGAEYHQPKGFVDEIWKDRAKVPERSRQPF